jgi:3-phosphoshikimate 1-carboxyvinyltransferase
LKKIEIIPVDRNMIVKITPSDITGIVQAPVSKSAMQRAAALALLHRGNTIIHHPGHSNDDKAALSIISNLGAIVSQQADGSLLVKGSGWYKNGDGNKTPLTINCGESGLSIRMFTPIASLGKQPVTVTGSGSLLTRPMDFFDEILPELNVAISSNEGKLPMQITGPLQPIAITVDGSLSSQFLTGLLIAFAKSAKDKVTITVKDLKSKPYIDLTLQMMKHFGYEVSHDNYQHFYIKPQGIEEEDKTIHYTAEGDWSGGAFLLVAGAIAGGITVEGLNPASAQADKAVLQALKDSGAVLAMSGNSIDVSPAPLKAFQFDATDCPDLFPPLVALAAYCKGTTTIKGISRLTHKESNRAITLQEEFGKMGLSIILQNDDMIIEGGTTLIGCEVHSRHDHRIAMALAVAGLGAVGETLIAEAEAVDKSYPDFYNDLEKLFALVKKEN